MTDPTKPRDFRNESRRWPTCGTQRLLDLGLNGFGLELFVESYWTRIAKMLQVSGDRDGTGAGGKTLREPLVLEYRGMTITLDPGIGLDEAAKGEPT